MLIKYQGIECISAEVNRSPGMAPGKGHLFMERTKLSDLDIKASPVALGEPFSPVQYPVDSLLPVFDVEFTPIDEEDAEDGILRNLGDLEFDASMEVEGTEIAKFKYRRMYLDESGIEAVEADMFDGQGQRPVIRVNLIDSRFVWQDAGELKGEYNVLVPQTGRFDPGTLKDGAELWSYRELLDRALRALPTQPVVTFFDPRVAEVDPPLDVIWDFDLPAKELQILLDHGGFQVALHIDDTVGIYDRNAEHVDLTFKAGGTIFGGNLLVPERVVHTNHPVTRFKFIPAIVRVLGQIRRQELFTPMLAVFTDRNGFTRRLNNEELENAQMTIFGLQATIGQLIRWIMRPHGPALDESEERLLAEAFRVFQVPSAIAFDFASAKHPLLPVRPVLVEDPRPGGFLMDAIPFVDAVTYREMKFRDADHLEEVLNGYIDSLDLQIVLLADEKLKILDRIEKALEPLAVVIAALETAYVKLFGDAAVGDFTVENQFENVPLNAVIPDALDLLPDDVPFSDSTTTAVALARMRKELDKILVQRDAIEEQEVFLGALRTDAEFRLPSVLSSIEFRKFFNKHVDIAISRVPAGDYVIDSQTGVLRFNRPMIILKNLAVDDIDSDETFEPDSSAITMTYSYEIRRGNVQDRASFLFKFNAADGVVEEIGQNAKVDVAPRRVDMPDLIDYLKTNGERPFEEFTERMRQAARKIAAKEFTLPKVRKGRRYIFAQWWPIEAVPPVSSVVIGTAGDTPETYVNVHDPSGDVIGYQTETEKEKLLRFRLPEKFPRTPPKDSRPGDSKDQEILS